MIKFKKLKLRREFIVLLSLLLMVAALPAFANFNRVETKKVFVYTKENNSLNNFYSKGYIQKINEYNEDFVSEHKSSFYELDLTPGYGNTAAYIMTLKYNAADADKVGSSILLSEYRSGLEKIEGVYAATISGQDSFDISYFLSVMYKILGTLLYLSSLALLVNRTGVRNRLVYALVFFLSAAGLAFNFLFILTIFNISVLLVLGMMERNREDAKYIAGLFSAAVLLRVLGTALMLAYNSYSFHSLFSYVQPDEINYYNTAVRISSNFLSGSIPNVEQIVGFKQYGYNLMLAAVNLINGEVFFASKAVNILVSSFAALLTYLFAKEFFGTKAAKISGIIICLMPTMIVFSAYTLRDMIIVLLIMVVLYLTMRKEKLTAASALLLLASVVSLWYLRNYSVLIAVMAVILYKVLAFADKKRINPLIVACVLASGAFIFFEIALKVYSHNNTFNMIVGNMFVYFHDTGIPRFIGEFLLSLVNLDFLVNSGAATYGAGTFLRMFYPDTLFLIVTFPFFVLGIARGFKTNRALTISLLLLFPLFIVLYKIYYGGWFLRTQTQVLPIQAAFISLGIMDVFGERYDKAVLRIQSCFSRFRPKIFDRIS